MRNTNNFEYFKKFLFKNIMNLSKYNNIYIKIIDNI